MAMKMEPLCIHVWTVVYLFSLLIGNTADAAPSSVAYFNDSRCAAGGVCPTDPLLFTCELNGVFLLRVKLPTGDQEVTSVGDTATDVVLPTGFTAKVLNIRVDEMKRNFFLTLSIANASLLNGGEMICDDTNLKDIVVVMAGCPLLVNSTGPPAAPYNLVLSSNTMNTATITWNSAETDVTYTVTSTGLVSPFSGIRQESFVLRDLEVETNYTVSVTATNKCDDESQPSEGIIVRIDVPGGGDGGSDGGDDGGSDGGDDGGSDGGDDGGSDGGDDGGSDGGDDGGSDGGDDGGSDGGDDGGGGSRKWLSTAVVSGAVGGGAVVAIIGGGTCLLLIFLYKKKTRTIVEEQKMILSMSPGPASPVMKDNPVDRSGDVDPTYTHQDPITTVDNSHPSGPPVQVVKDPVAVSNGTDPTYSVITDLHITHDDQTDEFGYSSVTMKESSLADEFGYSSVTMKESSLAEFGGVDPTFLESDNTTQTLNPSQPSSARPVNEQTTAGVMDPTYDDVITITHSPHPTTGVLYTDVNAETKKMVQMTAEVDDGFIYKDSI